MISTFCIMALIPVTAYGLLNWALFGFGMFSTIATEAVLVKALYHAIFCSLLFVPLIKGAIA